MLPYLRKIINVCESKENERDFFFNHETYTKIIIIDLIIVKLFGVCFVVFWSFPSRRKDFPRKFCALVCDCYFRLLILLIILFGTQHKPAF